ncbi:hypothetical protein [Roseibium denhamense]|uniref:hypothetical protein n=1 Tax=Roseibium denhamense TaxID=76305 RepID=UPI0012BB8BAD|nr:hypothetical protein [Roseibium denhamense]
MADRKGKRLAGGHFIGFIVYLKKWIASQANSLRASGSFAKRRSTQRGLALLFPADL